MITTTERKELEKLLKGSGESVESYLRAVKEYEEDSQGTAATHQP